MTGRVVTFATYALGEPRHGGQIRAAAMNGALADAGWSVRHCCVVDHLNGAAAPDEWVFQIPAARLGAIGEQGRRADVAASDLLIEDGARFDELREALRRFGPDVLVFHQPWLWPALSALRVELPRRTRLVYAAQNRETLLMADELKATPQPLRDAILARAAAIERDLLAACHGLVCVSEEDRDGFGFDGPTLVLRNGVQPFEIAPPSEILFVGSAHPPNAEGFVALLPDLDFLGPRRRIVVAGGVGALLQADGRYARCGERLRLTGPVDRALLDRLLVACDGIILPIVSGGGTNLKTPEALYSQKPIVATSMAFRGFEEHRSAAGVEIADTPAAFQAAIRRIPASPPRPAPVRDADALTWPALLAPLPAFLDQIRADRR